VIYFEFTFTAVIPLIFFTIASSIARSVLRNQKARSYLSLSLWFFKHSNYFSNFDDDWRVTFPIHQDIIISKIPLESMQSASQDLK
jgi:hypothetical protein